MNEALIQELQDHFDGRSKLKNVVYAMKSYTKDASIFFSYKDNWGNKKYINIPIEATDILPILEKYIANIEKDIIQMSTLAYEPCHAIEIVNKEELQVCVDDYKNRYSPIYTSMDEIESQLLQRMSAFTPQEYAGNEPICAHIPVCRHWDNKVYVFSLQSESDGIAYFHFDGIHKL